MKFGNHDVLPWPNNQHSAELARVVRMMAWAVRHKRPLDQAVNSLVPAPHRSGICDHLVAALRLPLPVSVIYNWLNGLDSSFNARVRRTAEALHNGDGPASALRTGFSGCLPAYAYEALVEAEQTGRLPETLTVIADQLERHVQLNYQCMRALDFAIVYFAPLFGITTFLMILIVPKFMKIAQEMQVDNAFFVVAHLANAVPLLPLWIFIGFCGLLIVSRLAGQSTDRLVAWIPLIGHYTKQRGKQSAASAMQAALVAGQGTEDAAAFAERTVESSWSRERLQAFAKELSLGTPWAGAWTNAGLGGEMDNLLLRGAALREDPAAGFGDLVMLQRDRLNRLARIIRRSFALGMTALAAVLTCLLVTDVFRVLIQIVEKAGAL